MPYLLVFELSKQICKNLHQSLWLKLYIELSICLIMKFEELFSNMMNQVINYDTILFIISLIYYEDVLKLFIERKYFNKSINV